MKKSLQMKVKQLNFRRSSRKIYLFVYPYSVNKGYETDQTLPYKKYILLAFL